MLAYLDSSAIVKRYIEEVGSDSVDLLYNALEEQSEQTIAFSSWNLGEVFGAIDTRYQRGDIDEKSMLEALRLFSGETRKFSLMRKVKVLPIGNRVLTKARDLVLKYHIYQADALQIVAAQEMHANLFVSSDRKLIDCAQSERIQTANPEKDRDSIRGAIVRETSPQRK